MERYGWIEIQGGEDIYEKMYHILFNAVTDAMEMLEAHDYQGALTRLELASRAAEDVYISSEQ